MFDEIAYCFNGLIRGRKIAKGGDFILTNSSIEQIAIDVIKSLANRHPLLDPAINDHEKYMAYDGSIFGFTKSGHDYKKKDWDFTVPIQVKGHVDKKNERKGNYVSKDVELTDLHIYYSEHGVLYFEVLMDERGNDEEIFYAHLTQSKSKGYLDTATKKKRKASIRVQFIKLTKSPDGSLFKLTKGEFDFIMDIIREGNPLKQPDVVIQKYTKQDFLSKVYMTEERYYVLEALLRNKMNVILQGAPGVGKTFTAKKLAYAMMGEVDDSRIEMVQFHQNYSYEDFIMGYRPDGADFKLTDGIFYRFCQTAANHPDKEYFFIIDEINRGNMSKIFGELLMLIEKGYRGTKCTLAYSGMPFSVPENLYIIGMMNTADRSLAMIDYALRRRFSFVEMEPGFNSEGFTNYQKAFANETFDALIDQVKILNKEITEDKSLGRGFQIGHSYFCSREPDGCTDEWMRSVVEFDILPMLSEYWFDEPTKLQRWEKNLRGVFDDQG